MAVESAAEFDGRLIPHGRLLHLDGVGVLNYVYSQLMSNLTKEGREKMLEELLRDVPFDERPGSKVVDDEWLPPSLRGRVAPAEWRRAEAMSVEVR